MKITTKKSDSTIDLMIILQMKKQLTNQKTTATNRTTPTAQKVGETVSSSETRKIKSNLRILIFKKNAEKQRFVFRRTRLFTTFSLAFVTRFNYIVIK